MKTAGRDFILIMGASAIAFILVAKPETTSQIVNSLGGAGSSIIAALQGRAVTQGLANN